MSDVLRASAIPRMVDVDGHIEEQLLRYGEGVTVRPMFQTIPVEDFEWSYDSYAWNAADEYLPRPPWALDDWERDLHGVSPSRGRSMGFYSASLRTWRVSSELAAGESFGQALRRLNEQLTVSFRASVTTVTESFARMEEQVRRLEAARDSLTEARAIPTVARTVTTPPSFPPPMQRALDHHHHRNHGPAREPFRRRGMRT